MGRPHCGHRLARGSISALQLGQLATLESPLLMTGKITGRPAVVQRGENSPKDSRIEPLNLPMPGEPPNMNVARLLFPLRSHSDGRGGSE